MSKSPMDFDGARTSPPGQDSLDAELDQAVPSEHTGAFLMLTSGERAGLVFPLTRNTVIIGRAPEAHVRLADRSVSSQHARIIRDSSGFEIEDLSSRNGTFLGHRRVVRARLHKGDRLKVGNLDLVFLFEGDNDGTMALIPPAPQVETALAIRPSMIGMPPMAVPGGPQAPMPSAGWAPAREDEGPSLLEMVHRGVRIYRFLRPYLPVIVGLLIVGVGGGVGSLALWPPPRVAMCEVKLVPVAKVNPMESGWRPADDRTAQFFADAEREFSNPDLVLTTLRNLGRPDATIPAARAVAAALRFEPDPMRRLHVATYRHAGRDEPGEDPVTLLRTHVKTYLQSEIEKTLKVFNREAEFLREHLNSVEAQLGSVNTDLVKFREANVDRLPELAGQSYASRSQMESRRTELQSQIRRVEGELQNVRRQLAQEDPLAQAKEQYASSYRQALAEVARKLAEARARGLGDEHPEVRKLRDEETRYTSLIQQQLGAESTALERRSNPAYQSLANQVEMLQSQLRAARAEVDDIDRNMRQVNRVVSDIPRVDVRLQELNQIQQGTQRLQGVLFERLKQAELQLELERVSVSSRYEIVTPAQLEPPPVLKVATKRAAVGFALALFIGGLVIAFREGRKLVAASLASAEGAR